MKNRTPRDPRISLRKLIRECEQLIIDVEWWNENRTDCPPMDCESSRIMLSMAKPCLEAFDRGDMAECRRLSNALKNYGESVKDE
jgi:hypothetical protein